MIGKFTKAKAKNIIQRTLWMESRGEGEEGMRMTLTTIVVRAGKVVDGMVDECFQNLQFSCWNDVASSKKTPSGYSIQFPKSVIQGKQNADAKTWEIAGRLTDQALNGTFKPTNDQWTSYYNPSKCNPKWASQLKNPTKVGNHIVGTEQWRLTSAKKKAANAEKNKVAAKTYTVKKGDSLFKIAKDNNLKVAELKTLNGLKGDTIQPGQILKLA